MASPMPSAAVGRAVALFTYCKTGESVRPATVISGVLLNQRYILTCRDSLQSVPVSLSSDQQLGTLTRMLAAIWFGKNLLIVPCRMTDLAGRSPLAVVEIGESDRVWVGRMLKKPIAFSKTHGGGKVKVVGVVGPGDLFWKQLNPKTVPRPVAMDVSLGAISMNVEYKINTAFVPVTLPRQMAGSGLWDDKSGHLIGVLVRLSDRWQLIGHGLIDEKILCYKPKPAKVVKSHKPIKTVAVSNKPATKPYQPKLPHTDLAGLWSLMERSGLKLKIDSVLLDYVNHEQADLVMGMIAAGKYKSAIRMLDDIEPLADGVFAEQLNYRRALALVLLGDFNKARQRAGATVNATDSLVRARGRLLLSVLKDYPQGKADDQLLSDPNVLIKALKKAVRK